MLAGISLTDQPTCTSPTYQPLLPVGPETSAETTGGVLSMLTAGLVKLAELPAMSVTVTDCDMPIPSFVKASGLCTLTDATPEVSSLVLNAMLTSEPFQPLAFAAG